MIEVVITSKGGKHELGRIRIENLCDSDDPELGNYSVQFAVDTAAGFATYQRSVEHFPRTRYNVLGLLQLALSTLDEKDLTLDGRPDASNPPNLARRLQSRMWPF